MDPVRENRLIKWIAGGSVLLMLTLLGFAYDGLSRYKAENDAVRRSNRIIKRTEALFSVVKDVETGCRGYLLTDDTTFLAVYHVARTDLGRLVGELVEILPDTDGVAQPYGLRVSINTMLQDMHQLVTDQRLGRSPPGRPDLGRVLQAKERMDALRAIHADLIARHSVALQQSTEQERALGLVTPMMILLYALLALVGIALLFFRTIGTLERVQRAERIARHTAEERDREARTREMAERSLKRVLDSSPNGIMAFRAIRDAQGTITDFEWTMANEAAGRLARRDAGSLIGRRLLEEFPEERGGGVFARYVGVVETGVPMAIELSHDQEGTRHWYEYNAVRLMDGFVVTFDDVTERRAQDQILQESQRLAVTGRFVRTVAHEVRNPLTNIQLAVEQLESEAPQPEGSPAHAYRAILKRNAGRIGALITQMLHTSRPVEVQLQPGPINAVLRQAQELVRDRCRLLDMACHPDLAEDLPFVPMDRDLLSIAFVNLCVNAIEAMESSKGVLTITSREVEGRVRVTVGDNGKGLTEEEHERIFQPFFSGRKGGMGLGLTEARNIFNAHGALLTVESEPGKGTSFILRFPVMA